MADHVFVVKVADGVLLMDCSCGAGLTPTRLQSATLDQLTLLAHDHIEHIEQADDYVAESAVASEDELLDLRNDTCWTGSTYGV